MPIRPPRPLTISIGGVVDQRDAVPQHVALVGLQQQRALADGEGRHRADADQARLVLPEAVEVAARQRLVRGPALAGRRHELTLLVADRAARGFLLGGRELRAAGAADEGWHGIGRAKARRWTAPRFILVAAVDQLSTSYFLNQPIIRFQASSAASLR